MIHALRLLCIHPLIDRKDLENPEEQHFLAPVIDCKPVHDGLGHAIYAFETSDTVGESNQ